MAGGSRIKTVLVAVLGICCVLVPLTFLGTRRERLSRLLEERLAASPHPQQMPEDYNENSHQPSNSHCPPCRQNKTTADGETVEVDTSFNYEFLKSLGKEGAKSALANLTFLFETPKKAPHLLAYRSAKYAAVKTVVYDPRYESTLTLFLQNSVKEYSCLFFDELYRFQVGPIVLASVRDCVFSSSEEGQRPVLQRSLRKHAPRLLSRQGRGSHTVFHSNAPGEFDQKVHGRA